MFLCFGVLIGVYYIIGPQTVIELAMLLDVIRNFLVLLHIEVIDGPHIVLAINFAFVFLYCVAYIFVIGWFLPVGNFVMNLIQIF